jgi:hypothetical protein
MVQAFASFVIILIYGVLVSCGFQSLAPKAPRRHGERILYTYSTALRASSDNNEYKGYRFGDITKGILKKATSSINQVTGQDEYSFGDLSRFVDSRVKQQINNITGQDEYVFGDLSRWADSQVKAKVTKYTGKDDYVVGDVSKEIIRRVSSGEYDVEDVVLLSKALISFGVGLSPVARFLPAKLLLEMIQFGLAEEVGGRLMGSLTKVLDERFKETILGDKNYRLGDKTKQAVQNLMTMATEQDSTSLKSKTSAESLVRNDGEMDAALQAELEDWDRRLGISGGNSTPTTKSEASL